MKQKTVLLTGASRGIGKSIKKVLEKNNYKVVAPTRKELDLNDNLSIERFIEENIKLEVDILINNAGINHPQWISQTTDRNIEETIQINLVAPIKLTRSFIDHMKKKQWGRIINISSMFGVIARGKQVLYSASKHGLNGATKALALELAPYNILVNSVCPGFINTDLVKINSKDKINALEQEIPLGRLGKTEEVANLVEFLISEKNSYITGATIVIDGGYSIK